MRPSFEETLVSHAAPVLAGIKPAALLSFSRKAYPQLPSIARAYSRRFQAEGLIFETVCRCRQHFLLLVYRPRLLKQRLEENEVRGCLTRFGYPQDSLSRILHHLRRRLRQTNGFPHEIGLFLGYPPRDVLAFLGEIPAPCLLCGYWKVYFNVEEAKQLFAQYDHCREAYCKAYQEGHTVSQLLSLPLFAA